MIENAKYDRNVMLFNLAFVFERGVSTRGMEQAVRKLARVLKNLEVRFALTLNLLRILCMDSSCNAEFKNRIQILVR
ncbi:hypothetical protein BKA69DRAFT_1064251 [Paraphysoderma sedebokerense]|nr:hypothetical protein BKA69DRAFT_1064251 [Paraphysoderma sedebokerense]